MTPELDRRALDLFEAALDEPSEDRAAFLERATEGEPELRRAVLALLRAEQQAGAVLATGGGLAGAVDTPPPEHVGPFRLGALMGAGGMGAVYRAERIGADFAQTVAIKIIRPGILSSALVERFLAERRTLASLEHPHIARMFDGGQLEDGSPYMVMELVDGPPILEYCRSGKLSLSRRLDLFADACRAVEHAHQNLVIHRDITPGNVLVSRAGLVKLIDFGISRPPEQASADGQKQADGAWTPGYAAPERAHGDTSSTLTDVFSLGVLLGELVEDCGRPSTDLAAIIARASAPSPDDRYPSVSLLLDDLARLRSGRTVSARKGGAFYPAAAFARRHPASVTAAIAAIFGLAAALAITLHLYQTAETARSAAEARLQEVRSLAGYVMFDLYDTVGELPASTPVRAEMASQAQAYLDQLMRVRISDLDLRLEVIDGMRRLGDVRGNPSFPNLGDRDGARTAYARAGELAAGLSPAESQTAGALLATGRLRLSEAVLAFYADLDLRRARALALSALDNIDRAARLEPSAPAQFWGALARATLIDINARADVDDAGNVRLASEMTALLEKTNLSDPGLALWERRSGRALLASAPKLEAERAYRRGDRAGALAAIGEAISGFETLMAATPPNRPYLKEAALLYLWRFGVLGEMGRMDEAFADGRRAHDYLDRFAALDPHDDETAFVTETIRAQDYAFRAVALKDRDAAVRLARIADARRKRHVAAADNPRLAYDLATLLRPLGDARWNLGDRAGACAAYREAEQLFARIAAQLPMSDLTRLSEFRLVGDAIRSCGKPASPT